MQSKPSLLHLDLSFVSPFKWSCPLTTEHIPGWQWLMCSHKPQQSCTNLEPSRLSSVHNWIFWLRSGNPRDAFSSFFPCQRGFPRGQGGRSTVSRCLRWKEGERGQGLEEHYVLVLNVYRSGHCRVRSVEKRGMYSDELSVHSSLCWNTEKGGGSQEGLSHLSLPLSMGRWGLPVRSGAGGQQWALSSPPAPGEEATSLAKSLSPFLATLPSSPAYPSVPSAGGLARCNVRTWDEQWDGGWDAFRDFWSLSNVWHQVRGVSICSLQPSRWGQHGSLGCPHSSFPQPASFSATQQLEQLQ